jgi:hypothetical protein
MMGPTQQRQSRLFYTSFNLDSSLIYTNASVDSLQPAFAVLAEQTY